MLQKVIKKNNEPVIKALNKQQAQADEILSKSILRLPYGSFKESCCRVQDKIKNRSSSTSIQNRLLMQQQNL